MVVDEVAGEYLEPRKKQAEHAAKHVGATHECWMSIVHQLAKEQRRNGGL